MNMSRKDFENWLEKLQNIKVYSLDDYKNDVIDVLFNEKGMKKIAMETKADEHRWYEMHEDIYKLGDWYIGVWYVGKLYSESSSVEDIGKYSTFYEVSREEVTTYKYTKIQQKTQGGNE